MAGYDKKSVQLSHASEEPLTLRLEVDVSGTGVWIPYQSFEVAGDTTVKHAFPAGFSANWIRVISDQDTMATIQFESTEIDCESAMSLYPWPNA